MLSHTTPLRQMEQNLYIIIEVLEKLLTWFYYHQYPWYWDVTRS